jgi:hypothetical protein
MGELTDCLVDGLLTLPDGSIRDCGTGLPPLPVTPPVTPPIDPTGPLDPVLEPVTP